MPVRVRPRALLIRGMRRAQHEPLLALAGGPVFAIVAPSLVTVLANGINIGFLAVVVTFLCLGAESIL